MDCKKAVSALADDASISDEAVSMIGEMFSLATPTKILEDGFQRERAGEASRSFNIKWRMVGVGQSQLRKIASDVHNFEDVVAEPQHVPRNMDKSAAGINHLFRATLKRSSMRFDDIRKGGQTAPWHSPAASNWAQTGAEMQLAAYCQRSGKGEQAHSSWLCFVLSHCQVLLRRPTATNNKWCFSLSAVCRVMGLAWPATTLGLHAKKYFEMKQEIACDEVLWLPILDLKAWSAVTYRWVCPMRLIARHGALACHRVVAEMTCEPTTLLKLCATNAFWDISKAQLGDIMAGLKLPALPADDLWARLTKLAQHALDPCPEEMLESIMQKRLNHCTPSEWMTFLQCEEADDLFDPSDRKLVDAAIKQHCGGEEQSTSFREKYKELRKRVKEAALPKKRKGRGVGRGRGAGAGRGGGEPVHPKTGAKFPAELAPDELTLAYLKQWMPLGSLLQRETYTGRWECNVFGVRRGRAWRLYGDEGSAREILRVAWRIANDHGVDTPFTF